ncbi:MAG TPA: uracil-DNA glycosylase [Rhodoferax sp.]|nr:uracil-DNA glycosylase [Rhodoferax sp.]
MADAQAPAAAAPGSSCERPPTQLLDWAPDQWPVGAGWQPVIDRFFASAAGRQLAAFMQGRLAAGAVIYPPRPFRALELTPLAGVRVVILGQDPYHGPGQAEGLAFSVAPGVRLPPSLRNIFKELQRDLGLAPPTDGSLVRWAEQGVLLLNTSLTVEDGQAGSHAKQGWEVLTDEIIKLVAQKKETTVFMLWGAHAQAKASPVTGRGRSVGSDSSHLVLSANHPSPLSALRAPQPFIGCGHFGLANAFLRRQGCPAVAW